MKQANIKIDLESDYFTDANYDGAMEFVCNAGISSNAIELNELLAVDDKDWLDELTAAGECQVLAQVEAFIEADYAGKGERDCTPNPFGAWV